MMKLEKASLNQIIPVDPRRGWAREVEHIPVSKHALIRIWVAGRNN